MPTIYIMDYDADIVYVLCKWLTIEGFETKGFTTLEQLRLQLSISQPEGIILDCSYGRMPLIINMCHTIRKALQYSGLLLLSSTTTLSSENSEACNATDFITKPFDFNALVNRINGYLSNASTINTAESLAY